jgi:hypothetical protein
MKTRTSILIAAAFVAAALGLSLLAPTEDAQLAPFVQTIPASGARVDSREFSVSVTDVRLADRVQTPEWTGTTPGVWLVVDIEFVRRLARGPITGTFRIGDTDYSISARAHDITIDSASSLPGISWAGSMLIELPASALEDPAANAAVVRFATQFTPDLDGVVDYTIDLTSLERVDSITLYEPTQVPS